MRMTKQIILIKTFLSAALWLLFSCQGSQQFNSSSDLVPDGRLVGGYSTKSTPVSLSVYVSVNGTDSIACIKNGSSTEPCRTLQYAYQTALTRLQSHDHEAQTYELFIWLSDCVFRLGKPFCINKTESSLKRLTIRSACDGGSQIQTVGDIYMPSVSVGCFVDTGGSVCVNYNVSFELISFRSTVNCSLAMLVVWATDGMVKFDQCYFIDNDCTAVFVYNSNTRFTGCSFINNTLSMADLGAALDSPRPILSGALGVVLQSDSLSGHHKLIVEGCLFENNSAVSDVWSRQSAEPLDSDGIGGGLVALIIGSGCCDTVSITNSRFIGNSAVQGGGLAVVLSDNSSNSVVRIRNCTFLKNTALRRGGAMYLATYFYSNRNFIYVDSCYFASNSAVVGGACMVVFGSKDPEDNRKPGPQKILFSRTVITQNIAEIAAAIRLSCLSRTKNSLPVFFANVTISNHVSARIKTRGPSASTGSFFTTRIDLDFYGDCYFLGNSVESALFASGADIYMHDKMTFDRNSASSSGGAIALADVSYMIVTPGTRLVFSNNFAKVKGGAMFVSTSGVPGDVFPNNPLCFLLYTEDVAASEWDVNMTFVNNGAVLKGAAVFANTLVACSWSPTLPYPDVKDFLHWSDRFQFKSNYLVPTGRAQCPLADQDMAIATATTQFIIAGPTEIVLSPGEVFEFHINATDELGNPVYSVATAVAIFATNCSICSSVKLSNIFYVIPPDSNDKQKLSFIMGNKSFTRLSGMNFSFAVQFIDYQSSFLSNALIEIKVTTCKPGFIYNAKQEACICNTEVEAISLCEGDNIKLSRGYWMNVTASGQLISYYCPTGFCKSSSNGYHNSIFDPDNPNQQCTVGRQDILCGHCKPDYSVHFPYMQCKRQKCDQKWLFIVSLVVIAILFIFIFFLVLYFNPAFLESMRGVLFFVQILPYVFRPGDSVGNIVQRVLLWVDLGGPYGVPLLGCWTSDFNNLYTYLFGYVGPFLIVIFLGVLYILNKFYVIHFHRKSPFEAVWILIVFFYKFMVETSLLTFFCVPFPDGYHFYYDGSVKCFTGFHTALVMISTVVIITCIIPPPIASLLNSCGIWRLDPHISDVLTKGLRKSCQWWWAFDLARRLVVISAAVFVTNWDLKQIVLIIVLFVIFAFHSICQPYKNRFANRGESFLLLCLTTLALSQNLGICTTRFALTLTVVIMAFAYCCLTLLLIVVPLIQRCFKKRGRHGYVAIPGVVD